MKLFKFSLKQIDWGKKINRGSSVFTNIGDETYKFKIENFSGRKLFLYLIEGNKKKSLSISSKIKFLYLISLDSLYQIFVKFEELKDDHLVFTVTKIEKIQRRKYYREYVYGDFEFANLDIDSVEDMFLFRSFVVADKLDIVKREAKGKVINISGGGFLLTDVEFVLDKRYLIGYLTIFDKKIPLMGEIVRRTPEGKYGVKFIFISDENRERIVKEIFKLQRLFINSKKESTMKETKD